MRRAATWLADRVRAAGLEAELAETDGHPVVVGRWEAGAGAPALVVYAHYDVQPPDPLEEWSSPPFEPTVRDGRLYARGAADDKSQVLLQIAALEACVRTTGLPVNVTLLLEGEEEIGSPGLPPLLESRPDIRTDYALIADSQMLGPGRPSLIFATRGLAYFELEARIGRHDLHSGQYGGAVPNPANALATVIASFHQDGRIVVPGFMEDVAPWDESLLEGFRSLPFDEAAFRESAGGAALAGEPGRTTVERVWTRPALDVNGITGGYTGEGAKTVLPAVARAKVSARLVANQTPEAVERQLRDHIAGLPPAGVEITLRTLKGALPWRADPSGPLYRAAGRSLEAVFGRPPVHVAHGGTLPIATEFERILGAEVAILGFALPGAHMHAPDEWFPLDHLEKGMKTMAGLYAELQC